MFILFILKNCFVTIFASKKYRQNNFYFLSLRVMPEAGMISPFQLRAMPEAGISRPFRALIPMNQLFLMMKKTVINLIMSGGVKVEAVEVLNFMSLQ